jgi:hypothetical protein
MTDREEPEEPLILFSPEEGGGVLRTPALDAWRDSYTSGDLRIEDHRALYERVAAEYPEQNYYALPLVLDFLRWANPATVLEMGGWDGALARDVFDRREGADIVMWQNHEVVGVGQVCDDTRYFRVVDTDLFLWEYDALSADAFVASHVLEHLTADDLMALITQLALSNIDFVYADVPLGIKGQDWRGTTTTHVLPWSISEFDQEWYDAGYKIVRKARRDGPVPSFVRFYGR